MLGPGKVSVAVALLLAVPATAGAAPKRADLKLAQLTVSPAQAAPGARLQVAERRHATAAARGPARAASATSSPPTRAGTRPTCASGRRAPSRRSPGARRAAAARACASPPRSTPGLYHLLACADAGGAVKERSERDNCAAKPLRVVRPPAPAAAGGAPPAGRLRVEHDDDRRRTTGGGSTPGPRPAAAAAPSARPARSARSCAPPNPLEIDPVADTASAATMYDDRSSAATAPGHRRRRHRVRADAPRRTRCSARRTITMTPISSIADLPLSQGLMGAVELEPHGLQLAKPATLTIDPPGTDPPVAQQSAFMAHEETGEDFHLHPTGPQQKATINLMHFSTAGVGLGTAADRAAVNDRPGSRPLAQLEQALADAARRQRNGEDVPMPETAKPMLAYYDEVVKPRLQAAETSEALAPDAIAQALALGPQRRAARHHRRGLRRALRRHDGPDRRRCSSTRSRRPTRAASPRTRWRPARACSAGRARRRSWASRTTASRSG